MLDDGHLLGVIYVERHAECGQADEVQALQTLQTSRDSLQNACMPAPSNICR
jgi:hypothetical protein